MDIELPPFYEFSEYVRTRFGTPWGWLIGIIGGMGTAGFVFVFASLLHTSASTTWSVFWGWDLYIPGLSLIAGFDILLSSLVAFSFFNVLEGNKYGWMDVKRAVLYLQARKFSNDTLQMITEMAEKDRSIAKAGTTPLNIVWALVVFFIAALDHFDIFWTLGYASLILIMLALAIGSAEREVANSIVQQAVIVYRSQKP